MYEYKCIQVYNKIFSALPKTFPDYEWRQFESIKNITNSPLNLNHSYIIYHCFTSMCITGILVSGGGGLEVLIYFY